MKNNELIIEEGMSLTSLYSLKEAQAKHANRWKTIYGPTLALFVIINLAPLILGHYKIIDTETAEIVGMSIIVGSFFCIVYALLPLSRIKMQVSCELGKVSPDYIYVEDIGYIKFDVIPEGTKKVIACYASGVSPDTLKVSKTTVAVGNVNAVGSMNVVQLHIDSKVTIPVTTDNPIFEAYGVRRYE